MNLPFKRDGERRLYIGSSGDRSGMYIRLRRHKAVYDTPFDGSLRIHARPHYRFICQEGATYDFRLAFGIDKRPDAPMLATLPQVTEGVNVIILNSLRCQPQVHGLARLFTETLLW